MTRWRTITTTYEQVKRTAYKTVRCSSCGSTLRRQKTFTETLNPFNTNADGTIKSRKDIWDSLAKKIVSWQSEPERCTSCKDADRAQ